MAPMAPGTAGEEQRNRLLDHLLELLVCEALPELLAAESSGRVRTAGLSQRALLGMGGSFDPSGFGW